MCPYHSLKSTCERITDKNKHSEMQLQLTRPVERLTHAPTPLKQHFTAVMKRVTARKHFPPFISPVCLPHCNLDWQSHTNPEVNSLKHTHTLKGRQSEICYTLNLSHSSRIVICGKKKKKKRCSFDNPWLRLLRWQFSEENKLAYVKSWHSEHPHSLL